MKTFSIKTFLLLGLFLGSLLSLGQFAMAGPSVLVNPLRVTGLNNFSGQNLTVYYAIGKKASIATEPSQINIAEVKAKKTVQIVGGVALLPKTEIPLVGIQTYNILVFVIHQQGPFRWLNVDGVLPANEIAAGTNVYSAIQSASKSDLDMLKAQTGISNSDSVVNIQLY